MALGQWLAHLARKSNRLQPSYVTINKRSRNIGCFRNFGMYVPPSNESLVVHYIKNASGMRYVWGMLHEGRPHRPL